MRKTLFWSLLPALMVALSACGVQPNADLPSSDARIDTQSQEVRPARPLPAPQSGVVDETPAYWFVEFAGPPTARGGSPAALRQQRAAFRGAAAGESIAYTERFNFERLFNGLSVRATPAELGKLERLTQVVAVYPVIDVPMPAPRTVSEPDMQFALGMTGADTAQNEMGLTGRGIKVGVIDSGVDVDHPEFAGRIVAGYDFVGDAFNGSNTPQPNPNPDDCGGHGTHVAGIIGAAGQQVKGVAPEVSLGAYRVFGCSGSTTADIIIQALERALVDGMDVVNMSLGAAYQWPQYPSAQASNNLVDAGVVVVASIGNSGATGVYSAGAPGVGEKVIGVASFDNVAVELNLLSVAGRDIGYSSMSGSPAAPTSGSAEITDIGRACNGDALASDPSGRVALIERGVCTFAEKALNAQNAGAVAAVVYNNAAGNFAGSVTGPVTIPVVSISQADGLFIQGVAPTTLTWQDARGVFPNPTGNLISSFSSYGLSPDLTLKPDLGAPGGSITSTYPLELGSYATLSGTSMSSPHVAGAVALLLEARPNTRASDVRGMFQNTAVPKPWGLNPALGFLDSVHRQGAGMINIPAAIQRTTTVSPAKLSLGESQGGAFNTTLNIRNSSSAATTYKLRNVGNTIATGGNTYTPSFFVSSPTVIFSQSSVTVPAGGSASVSVTITPNAGLPDLSVYGGYVEVIAADGGVAASVPYSGFKGNYQQIQVLKPTRFGFPWLAKLEGGSYSRQDASTYTMRGSDIAYVVAHFEHQSRVVKLEILPLRQVGGARDLTVLETEYFGRNSTPEGIFAFQWDGSGKVNGRRTPLPMGDYQLKLTVQKALGGPSDLETWTSPVITISRSGR